MNPIDVHVGRRLRSRRRETDLGIRDVAHEVGVSYDELERMEAGTLRVSTEQLFVFCRLYSMKLADVYKDLVPPDESRKVHGQPT